MMVFLVAILPGCQKKEAGDSEKFIKEFSLKSEDFSGDTLNVSYLKEEEIMEVLTNGTHVVLFAHAGETVNKDVALLADLVSQYEIACKSAADLVDESTEELERNIRDIEALNVKIRANLDKERAEDEAKQYSDKYDDLTSKIEEVRKKRLDLLNGASLPLPGLSVEDKELTYNGFKWDNMSGSEQLKVATAIVRKLNPDCGFVLMDKLEQMDLDTLNEFNEWLKAEGLQVIATRVSTGDECCLIIEDGYAAAVPDKREANPAKTWKRGEF